MVTSRSVRIVGPGRAGGAFATALGSVGWQVLPVLGRGDPVRLAAHDVDLVLVATPDAAIAEVAGSIDAGDAVVAHVAGSLGLDVLGRHARRAAVHPLVALPSAEVGAERLRAGAWFAVAGDPIAHEVVDALGGRALEVADEHRAEYHAAACIASNHLVELLAQAELVAAPAGVPLEAYLDLVRATVENVARLGPASALTGPAARGDEATLDRHRAVLDPSDLPAYDALVELARRLARDSS